ncbi:hypothetical protein D3C87_2053370 [compost metagenome]
MPKSGISGTYFRMSSSSDNFPSCANSATEKAVNCLEMEPTRKIDSGVMATSCSRFDMP